MSYLKKKKHHTAYAKNIEDLRVYRVNTRIICHYTFRGLSLFNALLKDRNISLF